jgi:glutamyl-tRNA reductase
VLSLLRSPADATVLVVGAGEMGKLAVRALARRVGRVVVANRDVVRASALAEAHDALAIPLADVPRALAGADALISAADTRGELLTSALIAERLRSPRPLAIVDVAVPRSLDGAARALAGDRYRSVDDLPGASARVPEAALRSAMARCDAEAVRFLDERAPDSREAIRAMRETAERVRSEKLERALQRLRHLSERDRRVVEALSTRLVNAILHEPTVALRERRADPSTARSLFERGER